MPIMHPQWQPRKFLRNDFRNSFRNSFQNSFWNPFQSAFWNVLRNTSRSIQWKARWNPTGQWRSPFLILLVLTLAYGCVVANRPAATLLTDPFLQLPTPTSVRVVWFTEFEGGEHRVEYGDGFQQRAIATTTKLSRVREDQRSRVGQQTEPGQVYQQPTPRDIWRHEAEVTGLTPGQRIPYRVASLRANGLFTRAIASRPFTLAPLPPPGTPLKILLTSDHQSMPMTATNLQKVVETVGQVDAVFLAGDTVNIPDRASEWFDDNRGGAFFPCLQGRASYSLERNGTTRVYTGGEIIQHAPMYVAIGNHEIMGRYGRLDSLNGEFEDAIPRDVALRLYGPNGLNNTAFSTDTYEEIFSLPQSPEGGETYYATTIGDVRLVSLFATNLWRVPSLDPSAKGRFREPEAKLNSREDWGYGQIIFEPIRKGSPQYNWLKQELSSPEFRQARYKIVMLHHPTHTLGDNVVPPYTDPIRVVERNAEGSPAVIRYDYPKSDDYLLKDVMPLLEAAQAQLVLYGHSHVWNRFRSPAGLHLLETSNVGNTYGAYWKPQPRKLPDLNPQFYNLENYVTAGDPGGLEPITPTLAPVTGDDGQPLPFLSSNDITAFTIFDTGTGTISSYRFDTRTPDAPVVKFDEFQLGVG